MFFWAFHCSAKMKSFRAEAIDRLGKHILFCRTWQRLSCYLNNMSGAEVAWKHYLWNIVWLNSGGEITAHSHNNRGKKKKSRTMEVEVVFSQRLKNQFGFFFLIHYILSFCSIIDNGKQICQWLSSTIHHPKKFIFLRKRLSYTWQHRWTPQTTEKLMGWKSLRPNHRKLITSNKMAAVTKIGVSWSLLGTEKKERESPASGIVTTAR